MFRHCVSLVTKLNKRGITCSHHHHHHRARWLSTTPSFFATAAATAAAPTSFANKHIHVETSANGITVLSFQSPPVNVVTTEFMASFNKALEALRTPFTDGHEATGNNQNEVGKQHVTRALILTSALPNTFLAGLDLKQMIAPELERYLPFRHEIAKNWDLLLRFPAPIVCVITGQCPGQGTVTAVVSDYRVMVEKHSTTSRPFRIGLNEAAIGLRPPPHAAAAFTDLIHEKNRSYDMLLLGTMVTAAEAVQIGLVDATAADPEAAMALARQKAERYVAIRPGVLRDLRQQFVTKKYHFLNFQDAKAVEAETRMMYARICDPQIQAVLKDYVAKLEAKKKKK